ncbi:MAG: DUF4013 domain-containing protein [Chloroflexota bacterium]
MNFSESLSYAFNGKNLPKILTIVLVAIIIGVSILVGAMLLESIWLVALIIPASIVYSVFISGYGITIIQAVMNDEPSLPAIRLGRDLVRGIFAFLAALFYMIPFFILTAIFFALIGATAGTSIDEANAGFIFAVFGGGLVWLGLMFVLGYSFIVGQIRYAKENRAGVLFNIPKNFGVVISNIGTTLAMFVRWLGIALVFWIFSSIILNVVSGFFANLQLEVMGYVIDEDIDGIMSIGMPLLIFGSLYYIISMTLSVMQSVSLSHLIAGYGAELGYAPNKLKNGEKSSGMTALLIIVAIIVVLGLMACGMIALLTMMGPEIGEMLADIIE